VNERAWREIDTIWWDCRSRVISFEDAFTRIQLIRLENRLGLTNAGIAAVLEDDVRPRVRWEQAEAYRLAVRERQAQIAAIQADDQ
jgi:hypothetical protein